MFPYSVLHRILSGDDRHPVYSVLTEGDKKELAQLEAKKSELDQERIKIIRKAAIKGGLAANNLEDLKSESGHPFIEEDGRASYKRAVAKGKIILPEMAYLCQSEYAPIVEGTSGEKEDTCGWVKGEPLEKSYDEIGPLSGSAGSELFCKICGKRLCRIVAIRS
ncbi:MAG: hypothetical protein WD898_00930 [Candidatus Paceibacterota bacterium]